MLGCTCLKQAYLHLLWSLFNVLNEGGRFHSSSKEHYFCTSLITFIGYLCLNTGADGRMPPQQQSRVGYYDDQLAPRVIRRRDPNMNTSFNFQCGTDPRIPPLTPGRTRARARKRERKGKKRNHLLLIPSHFVRWTLRLERERWCWCLSSNSHTVHQLKF